MRPPKILVIDVYLICSPFYYPLLAVDAFATERVALLLRPNFARDLKEVDYVRNRQSILWDLKFAPQTYCGIHSSGAWCDTGKYFASANLEKAPELDHGENTKRQRGSTLDPWLQKVIELHEYQQRWGDWCVMM